jgi:hypothetical protein
MYLKLPIQFGIEIKEDKVYPKWEYPIIPTKEIFRQAKKA